MAKKEKRFVNSYYQGKFESVEIWVDKVTGVNYLYIAQGQGGGLTPLLDSNGNPIVSTKGEIAQLEED
ncbi:DUF6440 family protein [Peptostreptococcus faecalis]|uniref:DUF6440 family protein n=1 Tax=Peptostreptococcus faecalis TaxID=2045015 RepID=UPI000C796914|nr:DUF6440 family protein [Peptostreptococcus faecalis]